MDHKTCKRCGEAKPVSEFHRNKRKSDGLDIYCKVCNSERMKAAYAKNPGPKIEKTRAYHLAHPEWSRERLRASHVAHKAARYEKYRKRGEDPLIQAKRRESTRRSEMRRRAVKALAKTKAISASDLIALLEAHTNRCYICKELFSDAVALHWDHYKPLASGGEHSISNLRPACADCNVRKNAVWPISKSRLEEIAKEVSAMRKLTASPSEEDAGRVGEVV